MPNKKSLWLRAAAPVAVLALSLTACGDDDGEAKDPKESKSAPAADKPAADKPAEGELATGESGRGEVANDRAKTTYEVAAQKVDVGTEADTEKLVDDPAEAAGLVPATAYVKFTNRGGGTIAERPQIGDVDVLADGNRGSLLIGAADDTKGCEDEDEIENWKVGESHVFCNTFMIPKDAKDLEVRWVKDDSDAFMYSWQFKNGA